MGFPLLDQSYCELRIYSTTENQVAINTIRFRVDTPGGAQDSDDLLDKMEADLATPFKNMLSANANYAGMSLQDFPARSYLPSYNKDGAGVGAVAGNMLPSQTCGLLSFRSISAGAKARGRMYIPFPSVASQTADGYPAAAYQTLANIFADVMIPVWTLATTPGCNVVPIITKKAALVVSYPVVTWNFPSYWATQRRRGGFGRPNVLPGPLV